MKTVILCGGRGTRLDRHGELVPKGLFKIGDVPLIEHLFKIYSHFGQSDFVLCLGHLAQKFGEHFAASIAPEGQPTTVAGAGGSRITLVDTGADTNTGGRILAVKDVIGSDERFFATYGDGLASIDIKRLLEFHKSHGKIATLTAVNPVSGFGLIDLADDGAVERFREKPKLKEWVNGGFFVFERAVFDYLKPDSVLEKAPFEALAREGQLMAYRHDGFWKCMDTFKDNLELNEMWSEGAPWKVW